MNRYTDDQKLGIFMAYERLKSVEKTQLELRRNFQIEPTGKTIRRIHENLRTRHQFTIKQPGRPRSVRTPENISIIKETAQNSTNEGRPSSTRRLALQMESDGMQISRTSIQRVLRKDSGMRPYHERPIHELKEPDKPRRVQMAHLLLQKIEEDPSFLNNIIWTDEANFCLNGAVNSHNTVFWSAHNPKIERVKSHIDKRGICMWAGIWAGGRIRPFEIEGRLTAVKYQNLLRDRVLPELGDLSRFWFMQDGAPAHKARSSQSLLREVFGERVIAIGWTPEWAARSPDLTPCDFYLWGEMKNKVYRHIPTDINNLRTKIVQEFRDLDQVHIQNACLSVRQRLSDCIRLEGATVQHCGGR